MFTVITHQFAVGENQWPCKLLSQQAEHGVYSGIGMLFVLVRMIRYSTRRAYGVTGPKKVDTSWSEGVESFSNKELLERGDEKMCDGESEKGKERYI